MTEISHDDQARRGARIAFDRRALLRGAAGTAAGLAGLGALRGASASPLAPTTFLAPLARPAAQGLPADAAPAEQQVYVLAADPTVVKVFDFYESVYARPTVAAFDLFSDPLVRMDKNFAIIPAAAQSWASNPEGTVWTFQIDPNLVWSDGSPVTAADWVKTFQYGADPAHAWDFTWFFAPVIKNWSEAVDGTVPLDQIAVRAGANDRELVIETLAPAPYLPSMLLYSLPLSKAALESTGPLYNTNPETAVSSGPFILRAFERDRQVVYERNPAYAGTLDVPIQRIVIRLAAPSTWFTLYQSGEIDFMANPAPQELQLAQADPALSQQIYSSVGDFRTFYLFFDVNTAPFDNPLVRQAFSHAVDRDAIQQALLGPAGVPAYSWLAPGFPAANGEALRGIQAYDPDRAKQLLADAGFPNGEGFPKQTMQLRAENPLNQTVAQAVAQGLSETLGIEVEVANQDYNLFTADLNAEPTKIPFGYVSYGMDFLDPYNMLSVWLTSGRHSYSNPEFDRLVDTAASFTGPAEERIAMFQEAERILVGDVPGVFVYHETPVQLVKPYMAGPALTPDENGLTNIHWPGYCAMSTVPAELYVGADAPADRG